MAWVIGGLFGLTAWAVTAAADEAVDRFVRANLLFTVHHEIAHMLISELELPITGREEDAADQYAWLKMLEIRPLAERDRLLHDALDVWPAEARLGRETDNRVEPWDSYSTDMQRYYLGLCLLVGAAPERFGDLAEDQRMPFDRQEECADEAYNTAWSWDALLLDTDHGDAELTLVVDPTEEASLIAMQRLAATDKQVRQAVDAINRAFGLPRAVRLRLSECGDEEAWWDPEVPEIVICYEELAKYARFARGD